MAKSKKVEPERADQNEHRGNSRAVLKMELKLETTPAQKIFERHFHVVAANLYHMTVMLPILSSIPIAQKAEELLDQYMNMAHEGLRKEIERMQTIAEQNSISDMPTYTSPAVEVLEITTPHAARFARIIAELDHCSKMIEAVWMGGLFSASQKNQCLWHAQNRVARLGGRIRNLNNSFRSVLAKGKNATLDDFTEAGHEAERANAADDAAEHQELVKAAA